MNHIGTARNRSDFKNMARKRLIDAKTLLDQRRYSGAYYLCGYVVECALKACIAKQTKKFDFPPNRTAIQQIYTHDLSLLVKSAGLDLILDKDLKKKPKLQRNWAVVKDWKEISRYEPHTRKKAKSLYNAISHKTHGVLQWISQYW
jgi:HEPN domain-containing protein